MVRKYCARRRNDSRETSPREPFCSQVGGEITVTNKLSFVDEAGVVQDYDAPPHNMDTCGSVGVMFLQEKEAIG